MVIWRIASLFAHGQDAVMTLWLKRLLWTAALLALLLTALALWLARQPPTTHSAQPTEMGHPVTLAQMEAVLDQPGPVRLQTVVSADYWVVPLAGLVNLNHPAAAGLTGRDEAIQMDVHVLHHPTRGVWLVDTGVAERLLQAPDDYGLHALARWAMGVGAIRARTTAAAVLRGLGAPLQGVLLTHLHLDHVAGLPDLPLAVPLYVGAGEATERHWLNAFSSGPIDRLLAGRRLYALPATEVLDVFGDASVFALAVPGHTAGSLAYVVRTPQGPVLLTGDASHTRWGWQHGVEPGYFSRDQPRSAESLAMLRALAQRHPNMAARMGHQP